MHRKMSVDSRGKRQILAVKLNLENESVCTYMDEEIWQCLILQTISVMSTEQIYRSWAQLAHSV